MELKKLLKKSSVAKNMGSSITIISVCFRIIKNHYHISELDGYIRHNTLFLKSVPREVNISIFKDKKELLSMINAELVTYDFRYILKDIITN
jgi:hypothetical protein